ncbi:MAG: indole-3-glycerol phosphate synthase TrpC [Thermoflexaceae bacterium]|nr:indole-3-glycerol phosphate synthase TrpC [Thermoflexaceae bacterium]
MASATILEEIVAQRRKDVAAAKKALPEAALRERVACSAPRTGFAARLRQAAPVAVIAEVKRASPSKGDIAPGMDAAAQALRYARGGAAAISVLTEPTWFKGTLDDMLSVRRVVDPLGTGRPGILRKDFIIDPYQALEAAAWGADAVLLIVACLGDDELRALMGECAAMGLEALVEVNNAAEAEGAIAAGATLIGINNRDLRSFNVDLSTTERLAGVFPANVMVAALSGISSRADVERFQAAGASAVLVGEALMVAPDPAAKIAELLGQ